MSFGDTAIDEIRPTRALPGRSLLTGLIANALGYEHRDVDALDRLQQRVRFAARLDRPGQALIDFQTAEISQSDLLWTTRGVPAERKGGVGSYSGPALRYRHYRADSEVTVALSLDPAGESPDLDAIAEALKHPERPLFIGRKGCPPSRPVFEVAIEATSLVAALDVIGGEGRIETEDADGEPEGPSLSLADRRDWRLGVHAGLGRRRGIQGFGGGRAQ